MEDVPRCGWADASFASVGALTQRAWAMAVEYDFGAYCI